MHAEFLWELVDWFSLPALAVLAVILFWRKLPREIPLFCYYIVIAALVDTSRFLTVPRGPRPYFYVYWVSELMLTVSALLATYELSARRLFPGFYRIKVYRYLFPVVAVIIFSAALSALSINARNAVVLARIITWFDAARVTLLFFFGALMIFMGRHWGRYELGIALGLAIDAAAFVITLSIWSWPRHIERRIPVIAYDVACAIWLIYFLRPEKPALGMSSGPISSELVQGARRTEEDVKDWLTTRTPSDR